MIRSAQRAAIAMIGSCGFTPRLVGNTLESAIHSRSIAWWRKSGRTTLVRGSLPMRQVPNMCVIAAA